MRLRIAVAALAVPVAVLLGAGSVLLVAAGGATRTVRRCSVSAAYPAILHSAAARDRFLRTAARHPGRFSPGGDVDRLICHDLTGDGRTDMAFTIEGGGSGGACDCLAFRRQPRRWTLMKWRRVCGNGSPKYLRRVGRDLSEFLAVYAPNDAHCCPSRGVVERRYAWNGVRMAVVRACRDLRREAALRPRSFCDEGR
jgi:hypothetical protein